MTDEPDFVRAKQKITDAVNWRGDVNISLGDETVTFKHRLLNENEFLEIKKVLDTSEVTDTGAGSTEAQERLLQLQQKEELTDQEEEELHQLSREVAQQTDQAEKVLGEDGYELLQWAGKRVIRPSEEDVEYVYNQDPAEMRELLNVNTLPNPITKDKVREHLQEELVRMIENQPYPIKLTVGMQALSETMSVLGNGRQR